MAIHTNPPLGNLQQEDNYEFGSTWYTERGVGRTQRREWYLNPTWFILNVLKAYRVVVDVL